MNARARTIAVAFTVLLITAGIASPGLAALLATEDGAINDPDAPSAQVTSFAPAIVAADGTVRVGVTVSNPTPDPVDVRLRLEVNSSKFDDRAELAAWLESPTGASDVVAELPAPPAPPTDDNALTPTEQDPEAAAPLSFTIPALDSADRTLTASAKELGLPAGTWGVYGLQVTLSTVKGEVATDVWSDVGTLTWADAEVPSLDIATVVEVGGGAVRSRALATAADVPGVSLLVDPAVASNLNIDPAVEVYRQAPTIPDLLSLAHAGDNRLLAFALSDTAFGAFSSLPWIGRVDRVDGQTATFAADSGAVALLLPAEADLSNAPVVSTGSGSAPLLLPDQGLSTVLADYRPGHPASPARLVAEVALAAAELDGPALVAPGDAWVLDGAGPSPRLAALLSAPWVTPMGVGELLSQPDAPSVTLPERLSDDGDLEGSSVSALGDALDSLSVLATAADDPVLTLRDWGVPLLAPTTTAMRETPDERAFATDAVLLQADQFISGVSIASGTELNLVAASGNVPVVVRNITDRDVTVRVILTSPSPNLRVTDWPLVKVPAEGEATAAVPVTAVSNSNLNVRVHLETAEGQRVGVGETFTIRVRADWGNAVTALVTVGLVLILIAGIIRTIRRGRKDTRTGPVDAPETALAEAADPEAADPEAADPEAADPEEPVAKPADDVASDDVDTQETGARG